MFANRAAAEPADRTTGDQEGHRVPAAPPGCEWTVSVALHSQPSFSGCALAVGPERNHRPHAPDREPGASPSASSPAGRRGRPPAGPRSRCGGPAAAPGADPRSRRSGHTAGVATAAACGRHGHGAPVGSRGRTCHRQLAASGSAQGSDEPSTSCLGRRSRRQRPPGRRGGAESVASFGDGSWPSSLVNDCSATAGGRIVTPVSHRRRCPALELDLRARTVIAAVTAEPVDSLPVLKVGAVGVSGPGLAPPPGAAHHLAVTLAVNDQPHRRLPQVTGMVGPVGLALS